MATETETKSTRDQVKELTDAGQSAQVIAEALNVTPATVYNHQRKLREAAGDTTPRKRGRPRKDPEAPTQTQAAAEAPKAAPAAPKAQTRPRPGPPAQKSGEAAQEAPKVTKATSRVEAEQAATNGHAVSHTDNVKAFIESELREAKRDVARLEGMLAAFGA